MGKELTNRQFAEGLGYALSKAEGNINKAVIKLETERKKIETFSIDTNSAREVFSDANKAFKETSDRCIADLYKIRNSKPKEVQIKDWIFYGFMIFATIGSLIWGGVSYLDKSSMEKKNAEMQSTFNRVNDFFDANAKQREAWEQWNKKVQKR